MPFTAQQAFLASPAPEAGSNPYGANANVRTLTATAPTQANTGTGVAFGTTAGAESTQTYSPYSSAGVAGSVPQDHGWAFPEVEVGSVAGARRFIPAGAWTFTGRLAATSGVAAAVTLTMHVYRVAPAPGRARSLLFTTSATLTPLANAAGGTAFTLTSAAQPQYTLEPGETLLVGFTATGQGQAVTGYTVALGTGGGYPLGLPGAMRTVYGRAASESAPAADGAQRLISRPRSLGESAPASEAVVRRWVGARSPQEAAGAADGLQRATRTPRALSEAAPAAEALVRSVRAPRSLGEAAPAAEALVRSLRLARSQPEAAPADAMLARVLTNVRHVAEHLGGGGSTTVEVPVYVPALPVRGEVDDDEAVGITAQPAARGTVGQQRARGTVRSERVRGEVHGG